ncbi:hypothetical protein ACLMJK_002413 [Lecanora helva]
MLVDDNLAAPLDTPVKTTTEKALGVSSTVATLALSGTKRSPVLPSEMWSLIMTHIDCHSVDELVFLWQTVRTVCSFFKKEVEKAYTSRHLVRSRLLGNHGYFNSEHKTFIFTEKDFVEFGCDQSSWTGNAVIGTFAFEYKELNPANAGEAIFEISTREQKALKNFADYSFSGLDDPRVLIYKELPQKGRKSSPAPHRKHLVPQCTSLVTRARAGEEDTVPGAEMMLDTKNLQVIVDWRQMLSKYFSTRG